MGERPTNTHPYIMDEKQLEFLCLRCVIPECDESSPACLYQIERRKGVIDEKRAQEALNRRRAARSPQEWREHRRKYMAAYRAKNPEAYRTYQRELMRSRKAKQAYVEN